jgi:hypothetical protein
MQVTPETIALANKVVVLHALLEEAQNLIDALEGTNVYQRELKQTAKMFAKYLQKQVKTWYDYHLAVGTTQIKYFEVSKDLNSAISALLKTDVAIYKVIPAFIDAVENNEIQTQ